MVHRKPLADWQIADARRLKRLFRERAKRTQTEFGDLFGIGSQGMEWQYLNGHTPLNLSAALRFAKGLGCEVRDFSPQLAAEIEAGITPPGHTVSGPTTPYNADEQTLLAGFRAASADRRQDMLSAARRALESASPLAKTTTGGADPRDG